MPRSVLIGWLCLAATLACSPETDPPPPASRTQQPLQSAPADRAIERTITYAPPGSRWTFDVPPPPDFRVESRRYSPSTPAHKIKERIEVKRDRRLLVRIEVWDNPDGLDASSWIDQQASHLRIGVARSEVRALGKQGARGIVVDQPGSSQAPDLRTAVFASGSHMVAITCADAADDLAREAFEIVLGSFAAGGDR